mmetsp:Transcript_10352/g.27399  ORF Transcript_10352/g.27399 Transcript_10352/m.27399 type:complete len:285 (-) Transcript_10352:719-1573(-)
MVSEARRCRNTPRSAAWPRSRSAAARCSDWSRSASASSSCASLLTCASCSSRRAACTSSLAVRFSNLVAVRLASPSNRGPLRRCPSAPKPSSADRNSAEIWSRAASTFRRLCCKALCCETSIAVCASLLRRSSRARSMAASAAFVSARASAASARGTASSSWARRSSSPTLVHMLLALAMAMRSSDLRLSTRDLSAIATATFTPMLGLLTVMRSSSRRISSATWLCTDNSSARSLPTISASRDARAAAVLLLGSSCLETPAPDAPVIIGHAGEICGCAPSASTP